MEAQDNRGYSPMIYAVLGNYGSIVHLLLESGANPNLPDFKGNTAMMFACDLRIDALVEMILLNATTDPNITNQKGETTLIKACMQGNEPLVDLLHRYDVNINIQAQPEIDTAIIAAVQSGNLELVMDLTKRGADIDAVGKNGNTALIHTSRLGLDKICKFLLKRKTGKVEHTNRDGESALSIAEEHISRSKSNKHQIIEMQITRYIALWK